MVRRYANSAKLTPVFIDEENIGIVERKWQYPKTDIAHPAEYLGHLALLFGIEKIVKLDTDLHNGLKFLVAASIEQIDLRTLDVELEEVDPPRVRATTKLREGNHIDELACQVFLKVRRARTLAHRAENTFIVTI